MRDQRAEVSLNIAPHDDREPREIQRREFRILVLGDFTAGGDARPLATAAPVRVDRDDLDLVLARFAPRVHVAIDDASPDIELAFAAMDDFHPDRLLPRLGAARSHRAGDDERGDASRPEVAPTRSGASLLEDMLGATADGPAVAAPRPSRSDELSAFIERAVAPHLVRAPDPDAVAGSAASAQESARLLRLVLHHPRVQGLEAAWRSVEMLVRRLDTDGDLEIFVLDVGRDQVADALERVARQRDAAGEQPWALAVALHAFPDGDAGADALARVAMAARTLGIACVAAAPSSLAGRPSTPMLDDDATAPVPEVYALIRRSAEARHLGLTFPRVLLRAPYGHDNPCDTIAFEEIDDPRRHDDFLWGSGAAFVALLIGEAFLEHGWAIGSRVALDIGSLPFFTYRRGPETVAISCAEMVMSERVARQLLSRGLMPMAWIRDTDRVRLVELRSVAEPAAPLAGAWAGAVGR